jgi:hypothetical protein
MRALALVACCVAFGNAGLIKWLDPNNGPSNSKGGGLVHYRHGSHINSDASTPDDVLKQAGKAMQRARSSDPSSRESIDELCTVSVSKTCGQSR